jgi:hypothetical protein
MDEHRLGLKPILRRVWALRGEQPTARVHWRYQWLWLYGFVHPESGETYFWILPRVNITLFNRSFVTLGRGKVEIDQLNRCGNSSPELIEKSN